MLKPPSQVPNLASAVSEKPSRRDNVLGTWAGEEHGYAYGCAQKTMNAKGQGVRTHLC